MSRVYFLFGVPDRFVQASKTIAKRVSEGERVIVYCPGKAREDKLQRILWNMEGDLFLPLIDVNEPEPAPNVKKHAKLLLCHQFENIDIRPEDWLLNLSNEIPPCFEKFSKVMEIVSTVEQDIENARNRWRNYKQAQHQMKSMKYDELAAGN
ncbi:DNA polymerase III subunit chi [Basilea psittacipulmonis]|uniref:DNA polymerase III subunit chi n=1 Tax=Basilea psittacipulmonis TaxID=1472345 RepID=UPI0006917E46|nr:DNA polymerase III subunit chi [Basilea psittacipulmonis]